MTWGLCVYPDQTIGGHGVRRTRKVCRAQQRPITRARTPVFYSQLQSLTTRQCVHAPVDMLDPQPSTMQGLVGPLLLPWSTPVLVASWSA